MARRPRLFVADMPYHFKEQIEKLLRQKIIIRSPGRPKKEEK